MLTCLTIVVIFWIKDLYHAQGRIGCYWGQSVKMIVLARYLFTSESCLFIL